MHRIVVLWRQALVSLSRRRLRLISLPGRLFSRPRLRLSSGGRLRLGRRSAHSRTVRRLYAAVLAALIALVGGAWWFEQMGLGGLPPSTALGTSPTISMPGDSSVPALGEAQETSGDSWIRTVLRLGLPFLDAYDRESGRPLWDTGRIIDAVLWFLGDFRPSEPVSLLRSQIPALGFVEVPETSGRIPEIDTGSLPPPPPESQGLPRSMPVAPSDKPLVIIYHTHAEESFHSLVKGAAGDPFSADSQRNVVRVGEELARTLQYQYGVPVVHLRTLFDANGREGAYAVSEKGVREMMRRYPSAKILIDVHRDSADRKATTTVIRGLPYARVLFVVGLGSSQLPNPNASRSLAFADAIATQLDTAYPPDAEAGGSHPDLVRKLDDGDGHPYSFARRTRYNQHLAPDSALIEIGGVDNTMEEELRSARAAARAIATVLQTRGLVAPVGTSE